MRQWITLVEQHQPTLILVSSSGKVETFHMSFQEFIKQRNLPHIGSLLDAGYLWCNFGAPDFIHVYWNTVKPAQISKLQEVLRQLGVSDTARCELHANGQHISTTVGRLVPIKPPPKRKQSRQALAAEQADVEVLDDDLIGNTLSRVVWQKTPTLEAHELDVVSLAKYPGVYALHVGDAEYWFYRLIHDYGNDSTAWEIDIKPARGDVLVEDVQYAIPDESGNKAPSAILLTTRRTLREGKDFTYARQLEYDESDDPIRSDDDGWSGDE